MPKPTTRQASETTASTATSGISRHSAGGIAWWTNPYIAAAVIFVIALLLRMIHYRYAITSPLLANGLYLGDSYFYDHYARLIVKGDWLSGREAFFMAPLYQYSLAVVYALIGDRLPAVLLLHVLGGAISCVVIFACGRLLFGQLAGVIAGAVAAINPVFIFFDCLLLPYAQTMLLHVLVLLAALRAARSNQAVTWLVVGLLVGICAVAHGTALAILPGLILWLFVGRFLSDWRARVLRSGLLIIGCAAVVSVVTVRNYVVSGDFVLLTSNFGMNLYKGNHPGATGTHVQVDFPYKGAKMFDHFEGFERTPDDLPASEVSRQITAETLTYIREHPRDFVCLTFHKFRLLFNDLELPITDHFYFFGRFSPVLRWPLPGFGLIAALGLTGAVFLLDRWRRLLPLYVILASQVATFTGTFVLSRYRLVLVACLMLFVGGLVAAAVQSVRERRRRPVLAAGMLFIALCTWTHWPVPGFDRTRGLGQQYEQLGRIHARALRWDAAAKALGRAVVSDFSPVVDPRRRKLDIYLLLAEIQERCEDWSAAAAAYQRVIELAETLRPAPDVDVAELAWRRRRAEIRAEAMEAK